MSEISDEEIEAALALKIPSKDTPKEKPPPKEIRDLITYLHAVYSARGKYPTKNELLEKFPLLKHKNAPQLKALWRKVNESLDKRDLPPVGKHRIFTPAEFDPVFVYLVSLVTNPIDTRSLTAKCKDAGTTPRKWNNWLRNDRYLEYYRERADKVFDEITYEMGRVALAQNVADGDLKSIQYFNEMTDKYRPTVDNGIDGRLIAFLMQSILHVIQQNVDGNTARKIAEEIDEVAMKALPKGRE